MLEIDRDLKDMIIQALRYALYRHTYALNQTCEYIITHQEILDERVRKVMINDCKERLKDDDLANFERFEIYKLLEVLDDNNN